MTPVPRVSLMKMARNPMSPRLGHRKQRRVLPPSPPPITMSVSSPLRRLNASMTPPTCSSSTSATTSSSGSSFLPVSGSVLYRTTGGEIESSNFSRRMFSMRTPRCSSPRPCTSNLSPLPPSTCSTRSATLVSASAMSRSQMVRPVRFLPSRPPRRESLTPKVIFNVGGSMGLAARGSSTASDATVSVTVARFSPATETMSPAAALSSGTRTPPCDVKSLVTRPISRSLGGSAPGTSSPVARRIALTRSPTFMRPVATRPVTRRPTNESCSIMDTSMLNSSSGDPGGGGTRSSSTSSSGCMSPPPSRHMRCASSRSSDATPSRAEAYTVAKSSCSSLAPIAANRSKRRLSTSAHPASVTFSRSTLFITTMGISPFCRAFPSTNLVCAIGPSVASTRSKHPSTMSSTRSTSPPKSACPGVSTALSTHARQGKLVYLEEMVMPRSFSNALLSISRSVATVWLPIVISVSSSVVLP
mmetsp:Transcript_21271/g.34364  ORF Transcript_21271/g.34364 Transcript_21271/m.34364 type:complete len:473 (+) Transcript_21271:1140-2558(+)